MAVVKVVGLDHIVLRVADDTPIHTQLLARRLGALTHAPALLA